MAKPKVAILGSGASAAYAYRSCKDYGVTDISILTAGIVSSAPKGAFYFHWVPPSIDVEAVSIVYFSIGEEQGYLKKQWGRTEFEWSSSFPKETTKKIGYNPAEVWPELWKELPGVEKLKDRLRDSEVEKLARNYDLVFQTFPTEAADNMTRPLHRIGVLSLTEQPELGVLFDIRGVQWKGMEENFILYNGYLDDNWVRYSQLFGSVYIELTQKFSRELTPAQIKKTKVKYVLDLHPMTKPMHQSVADNVHLVGRWATWDRTALSHSAYELVRRKLVKWEDG